MHIQKEKIIDNAIKILKCIIIILCIPIFISFASIIIALLLTFKLIGLELRYIGDIFNCQILEHIGNDILKCITFTIKYKDYQMISF